jgi:hypothetical protein
MNIREDLLEETEGRIFERINQTPIIIAKVVGKEIKILVDTGSEISAISDEMVDSIKKEGNKDKILTLKIAGIRIRGALGRLSRRINLQHWIPIDFSVLICQVTLVEVPGLMCDCILGNDFLNKYRGVIDFGEKVLRLEVEGRIVSIEFFEDKGGRKERRMNSIKVVDEFQTPWQLIQETLYQYSTVTDKEKESLLQIFSQFWHIFSSRPGLARGVQCKIKVIDESPFVRKSYPVPFSKRGTVDAEINRMLQLGVIERSSSPFSNPMVVVSKNDRKHSRIPRKYRNSLRRKAKFSLRNVNYSSSGKKSSP